MSATVTITARPMILPSPISAGVSPIQGDALPSLQSLAALAASGDQKAFADLHRRLAPALSRLLIGRAAGDHQRAEECHQRTWVAVWQALTSNRYDPAKAAITTFVFAVANKVWLQELRRTGRDRTLLESDSATDLADIDHSPAAAAALAELLETVRAFLRNEDPESGLTLAERELLLDLVRGGTDRAMAKSLGLAPSTVNARKLAALDKLRRWLARRGFRQDQPERDTPGRE